MGKIILVENKTHWNEIEESNRQMYGNLRKFRNQLLEDCIRVAIGEPSIFNKYINSEKKND